jgi:hypothetical protein
MVEVVVKILNWHVFLVHDAMQLNPDVTFKGLIAYWTGRQIFIIFAEVFGGTKALFFKMWHIPIPQSHTLLTCLYCLSHHNF